MRRRILATVLAALMALSLTACGGNNAATNNTSGNNAGGSGANATTNDTNNDTAGEPGAVEVPPVEDLTGVDTSAIPGVEDGVLTVGM